MAAKGNDAEPERHDLGRLGAFIRSQRRLAELSQRELAKLTNLSDPYVSQLERGLHEPSLRVVRSLAKALDVRIETMLGYVGLSDLAGGDHGASVEESVQADAKLSDTQKQALLEVYRSFLAS
ncbi:MAG: helix-turn-helix transcriptional regulator [Acidimicrobiales bacterium]